MSDQFLHGIEVIGVDNGYSIIETPRAGVIGILGTAPGANSDKFPLNTPVLIPGLASDITALGETGSLPMALRLMFRIATPMVVVVRVEASTDADTQLANLVGSNVTMGFSTGAYAFLDAPARAKIVTRILVAPWFSHIEQVTDTLISVSENLRGIVFADAPAGEADTYVQALDYAERLTHKRANPLWPFVSMYDSVTARLQSVPMSIPWSVVESKTNYYDSSSNTPVLLIDGISKSVGYGRDKRNTLSNLLNEKGVGTAIFDEGFRLWGNRTADPTSIWRYRAHVRLDDMVCEALLQANLRIVDKRITPMYAAGVTEDINAYLRHLASPVVQAIAGGKCWFDKSLNTADEMEAGHAYFTFDYGRFGIAEHVQLIRKINQTYVEEVFANAA